MRKIYSRIAATLMAAVMVFCALPATILMSFAVNAEETDTDYLFFATDRHTNTSILKTMITNMESKIGENKLEYLGLGGDMVGRGNEHPAYNSSTVLSEITGATGSLSAKNVDIVAGIHDMNVTDDAGIVLPYSGGGAEIYEGDKYYVYGVPESCISGAVSGVDPETEANDFVTWANGDSIDKSKVIIVLSHYPLHQRRNDNDYAYEWAEALNTVAVGDDTTIDRDVVFFWGHNHTGESDADTAVYHVAPGKTISVQGGSSSQTIYFTYANAGYLNDKSSATLVSITDTSITFDKYVSSTVSTTNTVTRVVQETTPAVTPSTLEVTSVKQYYVGETIDYSEHVTELIVTYSGGSTKKLSDEAVSLDNLSHKVTDAAGNVVSEPFTTSGEYILTYTYTESGQTATAEMDIDVYVSCGATYDDNGTIKANGDFVYSTTAGLTGIGASWSNTAKEAVAEGLYNNNTYKIYDVSLEGYNDGEEVTIVMELLGLEADGVVVYYIPESGDPELVSATVESVDGGVKVTFATTKVGTFAIGVPTVVVPDGATLDSLEITSEPNKKKYFLEDELTIDGKVYLDIDGLVVVATYTYEGETYTKTLEWDYFDSAIDGYALAIDGSMTEIGYHTVTVSYGELTDSFTVWVGDSEFTSGDVTVTVENPGTTSVNAATVTLESGSAMSAAISHLVNNYVAYDITLSSVDGKGLDGGTATVTLPIPEGVSNPVVYYVSDDGKTVTSMNATKDGKGNVTFTTDHFSVYVVGESTEIEVPDPITQTVTGATTTESKTVYVLVSSLTAGKEYMIVNANATSGYALDSDSTTGTTVTINAATDTITAAYIENTDATLTWTYTSSGYLQNASGSYLYASEDRREYYLSTSSSKTQEWSYGNNRLSASVQMGPNTSTSYLTCSSGTWTHSTSTASVYIYEKQTINVPTSVNGTYSIAGDPAEITKPVANGATLALGSILTFIPDSGSATTTDTTTTATYTVVEGGDPLNIISGISGNTVTFTGNYGKALVKVSHTVTVNGTNYTVDNYILITATEPTYVVEITNGDSHVEKGVANGSTEQLSVKVTYESSDGSSDVTDTATITWEILEGGDDIATIDENGLLTFNGEEGMIEVQASCTVNGKTYVDIITVTAKISTATTPDESTSEFPRWPNEGAVRFDKTATAVGNFSETGIAQVELSMAGIPVKTGGAIDVVVMLDMTGSMSDNGMEAAEEATKAFIAKIVKNQDGTYNDNRVAVYAFNSGSSSPYELVALTTIKSDSALKTANTAIDTASDKQASGGTPFDEAAKKCYDVLQAAKTTNLPEGVESAADYDRQQFCVFMSDGGPTTYYGSDEKTYYGGNNNSGDVKLTECMSGYSSSDSSNWSFTLPTEYYTDLMKADGVTVYTVGLLLQNKPSNPDPYSSMTASTYDSTTDSLTTIGSHYYFCSSILKQMASDESKYIDIFTVDNATNATTKFESIAAEITKTVTNVEVEDVITDEYDLIFELPSAFTDEDGESAADYGLNDQEFYIEVVDYPLDETTHERTGTSTIKQRIYLATVDGNVTITKITYTNESGNVVEQTITPTYTAAAEGEDAYFDASGNYYPEGDGTHHMTSGAYVVLNGDGTLKSLHTVNFTYVVATKQLNWTATSMSETSETALRYFVYLKDSGGVAAADQVDPGTYPTNKYATLNYTNVNDVECEQVFPKPQMTWNGAQVSYVFYLVNEDGVPVNRAGREVTFAEAIFVTDIFTHAIVWNDLEQAAGLEADYLASQKLPAAYSLFDSTAQYKIHVYEDEKGVNLNNHFVLISNKTIGSAGETTTYVYNNKTDVTKYNVAGAYVASDGDETTDETALTYLCKSYSVTATVENGVITDATYTAVDGETQVAYDNLTSKTGATNIDGYAYYIDENGKVYTIVQKTDGKEVFSGFDFANTTVAFAVVWEKKLVSDTVVVDFGLPVDIDVVSNDFVYNYINGIGTKKPTESGSTVLIGEGTYTTSQLTDKTLTTEDYSIKVQDENHIRFTPDSMEFNTPVEFYYETTVETYEDGKVVPSYMYSSVTVIPATTIYYEDSFVDLTTETKVDSAWVVDGTSTWTIDGITISETQDQDRPGASQISADIDADNLYGYDSAYADMSQYSMGSAAKVNVYSGHRGRATFEFYGTGFDVISLTSNKTGTITVNVYAWDANTTNYSTTATKSFVVDTYYGYSKNDAGEWVVSVNDPNALYQVPVMKINGLDYGKYKVVITAAYGSLYDHKQYTNSSYDFYLDAIRIYDPTGNTNDVANDAYVKDNEGWPVYEELRNNVISAEGVTVADDGTVTFPTDTTIGAIFIDCNNATTSIVDYVSYGPNNELYLASGQAIAFTFTPATKSGYEVDTIQIALKSVGGTAYAKIYDASATTAEKTTAKTIATATDMYYDITDLNGKTVVIYNSGESTDQILSITNIKVTYKAATSTADEEVSTASAFSITPEAGAMAVMSLRAMPVVEEETEDTESEETTAPETETETETETEAPETETETETEVETETETETEAPETETEPEDTESEDPEASDPVAEVINKVVNTIKKAFNKFFSWFR